MVLMTFWFSCFLTKINKNHTFLIFSTPLMKYHHFWYVKPIVPAQILAKSICQNWHSRARGVAKIKNVIPMLGGKHYFFWSPCCVGVPVLIFSTPLRRECSKNWFPENFQMILHLLAFVPPMRASLFLTVLKSVIPTQRGDHIFKVKSREVNCCDAEMLKYHWKTKQNHVPSNKDQSVGCVWQRTSAMEWRQCGQTSITTTPTTTIEPLEVLFHNQRHNK